MTLIVSHNFAGDTAAGSGLGTADTGQVWTTESGSWKRLGGKANGTTDGDITSISVGASNMLVESNVGAMATGKFYEVMARVKNIGDFYWAEARPDGSVSLQYAFGAPLIVSVAGVMPAIGGKLGIKCENTLISAFVNSVEVLSVSSTQLQNGALGTRAGYRHGADGVQILDYSIFRASDLLGANVLPTANAGPDQNVTTGSSVTLSGSGTDSDGTIASYAWTLTSKPATSTAVLAGTGSTRTFTADLAGTYVASLVVTDNVGGSSAADTVSIVAGPISSGFFFAAGGVYVPTTMII